MALKPEEYGAAQSLYSFSSSSGSCLFGAVAGFLMSRTADFGAALTTVFRVASIGVAFAFVIALIFVRVPRSAPDQAE